MPGLCLPDPDHSSQFEFCENGAKAVADEAMKAKVTPEFFAKYDVEELSRWSDYELNSAGRIAKPVYLATGKKHYEEISWDDAFKIIANHLNKQSNPDRAVFYTSGKTPMKLHFCIRHSLEYLEQIIFLIAQICVTSPVERHFSTHWNRKRDCNTR